VKKTLPDVAIRGRKQVPMTMEAIQTLAPENAASPEFLPCQLAELDLTESDDGYIIYEPEKDKVHHLNPTAVLILELCDGATSIAGIAELVKEAYGLTFVPLSDVQGTIATLSAEGLVSWTRRSTAS
jgi:hypothetical protein